MICPHCKESMNISVEGFVMHVKKCQPKNEQVDNQHKKEVEDVRN